MALVTRQPSTTPPGGRIVLYGPQNTLKTTSSLSWPKGEHRGREGMLHHISLPGEQGWETVPAHEDTLLRQYVWQLDEVTKSSPHAVVKEVEGEVFKVAAGAYGPVLSLVVEGIHKMYDWYFKRAFVNLQGTKAYQESGGDDEKITGRAYGQAHDDIELFLTRILSSSVPYVLLTSWEGETKDDPKDQRKKAPTHTFPELPGKMARRLTGMVSVTMFAKVEPGPQGKARGVWILKQHGDVTGRVGGVGLKMDPALVADIPALLKGSLPDGKPDWRALRFSDLEPYLLGEKKAEQKSTLPGSQK